MHKPIRSVFCVVACASVLLLLPARSWAQSTSAIAGVVKDASGGVLPGVTVEAASPALIEKTRTVVSDGQGQYKIVDLRSGVYTVTFSLPGFTTIKREGVELTAAFTANVNAELRVGSLEETITVAGSSPTVDIQNVVQQRVMTRDIIDAVPVGNKNVVSIGVLIPGVITTNQDVGGTAYGSSAISVHGGRVNEEQLMFDGMYYNNGKGVGGVNTVIALNDATIQEVSLEVGGMGAEAWMGGIRTNVIPKDGGNTFKGYFFGTWTTKNLQSTNLSPAYVAQGLLSVDTINDIFDFNPAYGGPILKDRLWFYGSPRLWSVNYAVGGLYYNASSLPYVYTPDLARPARQRDIDSNVSLRLTWQVTPRNKLSIHPQHNTSHRNGNYNGSRIASPEAVTNYVAHPSEYIQAVWTSPRTSRLLLDAGTAFGTKNPQNRLQPGVTDDTPSYRELSTNLTWNNNSGFIQNDASHEYNHKFSVSYVTGSHAVRTGAFLMHGAEWNLRHVTGNQTALQLLNGVPRQVTVFALPAVQKEITRYNLGFFAQDQWTIHHLTLNLGMRYNRLNSYIPASHAGPTFWTPTRNVDLPEVDNVPTWQNVTPRFGIAYDVFGNGKTAVKASIGKYLVSPDLSNFTRLQNPINTITVSATRTWTDANGDFLPQVNELGALSNANFGNTVVASRVADEVNSRRGYDWQTSVSLQHELLPRMSVTVAYFRTQYGNLTVIQNTAVTSADFSPYCITAPVDSRLPGGGGNQICGFSDVSPAKFGRSTTVQSFASNFGKQEDVYDGVDVNMNARLPRGVVVSGGSSWGRQRTNNCYALNDLSLAFAGSAAGIIAPRTSDYCDIRPPFAPNAKFLAVFPLPWWGLQTSGTFQSLPGAPITASYVATNAQIAPTLGRNLSSGAAGTATVDLIPPGTQYGKRLNQVNFRASKNFKFGQRRIQVSADLYNMFNADSVLSYNIVYGPAFLRPAQILQGRLLKFGTQIDF